MCHLAVGRRLTAAALALAPHRGLQPASGDLRVLMNSQGLPVLKAGLFPVALRRGGALGWFVLNLKGSLSKIQILPRGPLSGIRTWNTAQ